MLLPAASRRLASWPHCDVLERRECAQRDTDETAEASHEGTPGHVAGRDHCHEDDEQRHVNSDKHETGNRSVIGQKIVRVRELDDQVHRRLRDDHRTSEAQDRSHAAGTRGTHYGGGHDSNDEGPRMLGGDRRRQGCDHCDASAPRGQGRYNTPPWVAKS